VRTRKHAQHRWPGTRTPPTTSAGGARSPTRQRSKLLAETKAVGKGPACSTAMTPLTG
jgi:hypothetical protein